MRLSRNCFGFDACPVTLFISDAPQYEVTDILRVATLRMRLSVVFKGADYCNVVSLVSEEIHPLYDAASPMGSHYVLDHW